MMHERSVHPYAQFVTLTYSSESLPHGGGLVKKDVQDWLKRLRKMYPPKSIRYFACGEYGSRHNRPHYHAIIYSDDIIDESVYRATWSFGQIKAGNASMRSCMYVAKYIGKQFSGRLARERYGLKQRPFALMSKGLGKEWLEKNKDQLVQNLALTVNGKNVAIPRYYRKLLGDALDTEEMTRRARERHAEYYDAVWQQSVTGDRRVAWPHEAGQAREDDARSLEALYKDKF